jgi:hypothetical protein
LKTASGSARKQTSATDGLKLKTRFGSAAWPQKGKTNQTVIFCHSFNNFLIIFSHIPVYLTVAQATVEKK